MLYFLLIDIDGMWGPWGEGPCSESDCEGTMSKVRACNNPAQANNGSPCDESVNGASVVVACNTNMGACPVVLDVGGEIGLNWQDSFSEVDGTDFNSFEDYIRGLVN
jgi:hypothetical protein